MVKAPTRKTVTTAMNDAIGLMEQMADATAELVEACRPLKAAWDRAYNPGVADLDADQPIHITVTKGELQRFAYRLRAF